jgi:TPR repeat protein
MWDEAVRWFISAANQDSCRARVELAIMYGTGKAKGKETVSETKDEAR